MATIDIRRGELGPHLTRRRVVASVVHRMNEVTLHRARLVLGWVTDDRLWVGIP